MRQTAMQKQWNSNKSKGNDHWESQITAWDKIFQDTRNKSVEMSGWKKIYINGGVWGAEPPSAEGAAWFSGGQKTQLFQQILWPLLRFFLTLYKKSLILEANEDCALTYLKKGIDIPPKAGHARLVERALFQDKPIPKDYMCPSSAETLQDCICPFCKRLYPSKTATLRHRRKVHKFQRAHEFELQVKLELKVEKEMHELAVTDVLDMRQIGRTRSKEYLCVFPDFFQSWERLPKKHPAVVAFLEKVKKAANVDVMDPFANPTWLYQRFEPA